MQNLMYGLFVDKAPIAETLISRPEWLEGVYRIFNWEPCALHYYQGQLNELGGVWLEVIRDLCGRGHLDRLRFLTNNVQALLKGFKPDTINDLVQAHDDLAPTDDERKQLEGEYLALLASPNTAVVGFALKQLNALAKAKRLDAKAYFRELSRVYQCPAKGHVKTALSILKLVAKQQADLAGAAALAAAGC